MAENLKAVALVCSLNPSPTKSSSDLIATQLLEELKQHGVAGTSIRVADHMIKHGVAVDMGEGDEWPHIRTQILAADILVIATPIWMGHPASYTQMVLERLDADISETDERGRPIMYDKVAIVAVVGNEDGAHKVSADVMQGLNDVGFTIPAGGVTYWVGEAMQSIDYKDLEKTPEKTAGTNKTATNNAAHLAKLLRKNSYPEK